MPCAYNQSIDYTENENIPIQLKLLLPINQIRKVPHPFINRTIFALIDTIRATEIREFSYFCRQYKINGYENISRYRNKETRCLHDRK